jgi:hypothetical protein
MPTRQELFEIAHRLGHRDPAVYETPGGKFFATCSCGWKSTNRLRLELALEAGVHHALSTAQRAVREANANGNGAAFARAIDRLAG